MLFTWSVKLIWMFFMFVLVHRLRCETPHEQKIYYQTKKNRDELEQGIAHSFHLALKVVPFLFFKRVSNKYISSKIRIL